MGYLRETLEPLRNGIDCYWQSDGPGDAEMVVYPSLPEPYLNLFFPIHSAEEASIKGISSNTDFIEVRSALFGVRLFLRGFFQMNLAPCAEVVDRLLPLKAISTPEEAELAGRISEADTFEDRVTFFRAYVLRRAERPLSLRAASIADTFQYLVTHYSSPTIIRDCATVSGVSPRTISRWFSEEIGVSPKKVARLARFHTALSGLHTNDDPGFYLDCGYYDQAHFIRDFKAFTGITPDEYARLFSRWASNVH